ncbi:hypothetical protein GMST_41480 [Geomonas silvestris]|uniref:Peptidase S11 D-alanyl-D-alanine carboxypeptidase A N-terminal domain-containing protein n=1 Tax=Geomonas silvestris TaxID=2740184 RepID=A0A6V8MQ35_9BACT|nr:D-alanyl-D-alanine carboxypeptidase family protein [Geomonas silvestris]GFO61823.1 hypothetical protein GMST_41480 [Geomonas silvestris]
MKIFSLSIIFLVATLCLSPPPALAKRHPGGAKAGNGSSYLVLINGKTFREQNADLRRPPASLTKIMTALIILERARLDDVVTVSRAAAGETGSRVGVRRGERFRVRDLLAASLIASANDATRALADHVAGSQPAFVQLMNERAHALGLGDTRFSNVCGHDQKGLYTTARDLVILTERALRLPAFADLVAQRSMRIQTATGRRTIAFHNVNRLIGRYAGARGVKTGTTPNAGQCLVAVAERDNIRVFLVLMHSRKRWQLAPALLDAGFARARAENLQVVGRRENDAAAP